MFKRLRLFFKHKAKKIKPFCSWVFSDVKKKDYKTAIKKIDDEYKETLAELYEEVKKGNK